MAEHGISDRMRSLCPEGFELKRAHFVRSESMKRRPDADDGKDGNENAPDAWDEFTIALVTPPETLGGNFLNFIFYTLLNS